MEKVRPPKYAQRNAKKALECIKQGSKAMTKTGRKRAKQLAKGELLTLKDLKEIDSFRRHKQNAKYSGDYCKDKGAVAWLGWGGSLEKGKGKTDFFDWAKRKKRSIK